ncbi:hypothetical protein N7516_008537 [Penicillium verrucosum]|uniref:uncharacterized protein n=1 Tax=Penicillium verrucosum TaxID=60171 RepID=UPI0025453A4B|nr:uncharacterized protein N7516_008537 [Penicillium verrucosum]KAJ5926764.1 hypothetical protein N7516_008537 [Penicillium verrucosum]
MGTEEARGLNCLPNALKKKETDTATHATHEPRRDRRTQLRIKPTLKEGREGGTFRVGSEEGGRSAICPLVSLGLAAY